MKKTGDCPCGSGKALPACCGPYLAGLAAPDAERLMRSRYTAYARGDEPYLLATWHSSTRPGSLDLNREPKAKWIGLEVKRHEQTDESHAVVEFVARYRVGGRAQRLSEVSRFVKEDGRWYYVEGKVD
ncbi:MAG: YchJ family metal-binding protein [Rhodocyclaceae bacterium]|nr:YchJ family metal-binding protein [Rhodocyclaceae bacterium]